MCSSDLGFFTDSYGGGARKFWEMLEAWRADGDAVGLIFSRVAVTASLACN